MEHDDRKYGHGAGRRTAGQDSTSSHGVPGKATLTGALPVQLQAGARPVQLRAAPTYFEPY